MRWLGSTYRTTLGKKLVMAVTGAFLFGFVLLHMLGNLQVFLGPEALNRYARFLRVEPALLWGARALLLAAVTVHIVAAVQLTLRNWEARPVGYHRQVYRATDYASRTMVWSGPIIAAFVVYHILHLSVGSVHPDFVPGDVYHNVIAGFRVPYVSAFYILAQVLLGVHLYHGLWSAFQSVGASRPSYGDFRRTFALAASLAIVVGNCSIPLAVLAGFVG
jgi:succinate dehydrogenase / fumarate reductase cytochrome b subunit